MRWRASRCVLCGLLRCVGAARRLTGARRGRAMSGRGRMGGLLDAPVVVFGSDDPLDIIEALIESNKQRAKTGEQIGREAQALLDVESQRAKRRQAQQALMNQPQASPVQNSVILRTSEKGRANDKVGEQLGISGSKAVRAATVVKTIDTLEQDGIGGAGHRTGAHGDADLVRRARWRVLLRGGLARLRVFRRGGRRTRRRRGT